ncbi:MAG: hypothetical protein QG670_619 [Thermoproteota archaeon]|nr:hypothetical protein [Thermoproteota archaeon]
MFDFRRVMMTTSLRYVLKLVRKIERYEIDRLEEPFPPDDVESYAALCRETSIPVAGIEHEYTSGGLNTLLRRRLLRFFSLTLLGLVAFLRCGRSVL